MWSYTRGVWYARKDGTTFINASVLNEKYVLVNEPIVFEV